MKKATVIREAKTMFINFSWDLASQKPMSKI